MAKRTWVCTTVLMCLFGLFMLVSPSGADHTITFKNQCDQTIWVGQDGTLKDGWEMKANTTYQKTVPTGFSGRWWPRTGCNFGSNGVCPTRGEDCCTSGGCLTTDEHWFGLVCNGGGSPPVSLFEPTFDAASGNGPIDYLDLSMVDGFSVPMQMSPDAGTYNTEPDPGMDAKFWCQTKGWAKNPTCPDELWDKDRHVCWGPCKYYIHKGGLESTANGANICCSNGNTANPSCDCSTDACAGGFGCSPYNNKTKSDNEACWALDVGKHGYWGAIVDSIWPGISSTSLQYVSNLHQQAPSGYAWQFDDFTSTFNCRKTGGYVNYTVTFCPGGTSNYTLTVSKGGAGAGTVTSDPSGISCGSTCTDTYSPGTSVTLSATAGSGSTFSGWSGGGCSGTGNCMVTMSKDVSVTATFVSTPATCTYTIGPKAKTFNATAGTQNVNVTGKGAKGVSCDAATAAVSVSTWISAIAPVWKNNHGTGKVTVSANSTSSDRTGTVTFADQTFNITQKGGVCNITALTPARQAVPVGGGSYSFNLTVTPSDCAWTAAANKSFISITSGSGTGSGTVTYTVPANTTGKGQNGAITVTLTKNNKKKAQNVSQAAK